MADFLSKQKRSTVMSAIRSRNNATTELVMLKILRSQRITGWRRHLLLPGKPDFAWKRRKIALFIDGCFWHGCKKCYQPPTSNAKYWSNKISTNMARDKRVNTELRKKGWKILRIRECDFSSATSLERKLKKLKALLLR